MGHFEKITCNCETRLEALFFNEKIPAVTQLKEEICSTDKITQPPPPQKSDGSPLSHAIYRAFMTIHHNFNKPHYLQIFCHARL